MSEMVGPMTLSNSPHDMQDPLTKYSPRAQKTVGPGVGSGVGSEVTVGCGDGITVGTHVYTLGRVSQQGVPRALPVSIDQPLVTFLASTATWGKFEGKDEGEARIHVRVRVNVRVRDRASMRLGLWLPRSVYRRRAGSNRARTSQPR
jgi:hypothetical protein